MHYFGYIIGQLFVVISIVDYIKGELKLLFKQETFSDSNCDTLLDEFYS